MPERIDDADDPRLADYRQLKDPAARRAIEGDALFVAEGPVALDRLLASGHRLRSVLIDDRKLDRMRALLEGADAPVYLVDRSLMREIVGFDLHRGVIAAGDRRSVATLAEILASSRRIAVLEGLNDPENLGAIARSARAFGVDAMVLDPTCIDPYTRRTVRVSMGEVLFLRWCRATADEWPGSMLSALHDAGFDTWAMTPSGDHDVWTLQPPERLAIALGAEGPGLSPSLLDGARRRVRVPIDPDVDSLNVAAAAAVTFAVAARRTH